MYAFRTLYRLAVAKKVKINYFVVDARTGRGIDRSLDRIKSRATRLPFPRVFLPYFFFFFLPPPLPPFFLIFLIFIFIAADTNAASVLFFSGHSWWHTTKDDYVVRCGERVEEEGGVDWLSRGQSSSFDASPWKRDLSRRWGERVEGVPKILGQSRVNSKRIFILE